jgi:hypothetical protein
MTADNNNSLPLGTSDPVPSPCERLVQDARAGLTPSQLVERKLASLLGSTTLPISRLQNSERRRPLS